MAEEKRSEYEEFIGKEMKGGTFKVTQKKITSYCEAVGHTDPRYIDGNIEGGTVAPPEFAAVYAMGAWSGMISLRDLITDIGKLLHTGQSYEYFEPVKPDDILTAKTKLVDVYEKANMLWIVAECSMYNQDGKLATISRATAGIRPGGFKKR